MAVSPSVRSLAFEAVFYENPTSDEEAAAMVRQEDPTCEADESLKAVQFARRLMEIGCGLANECHNRTGTIFDMEDLHQACPDFTAQEYEEAWNLCMIWAGK